MEARSELDNPYTLQFSYVPPQFIERASITAEITENYIRGIPTYRGMFITGVRGSGKTVMLGDIRKKIDERSEWITVDLNPESNLLDSLARTLYLIPELKALFVKARLDFAIPGIGLHVENAELVASNEEDAVTMMLRTLKTAGKKVLVTIDEVTYSKDVARFSHALSSYAGADYDIYVLMTGLLENIKKIKNEKSLTFLYRAKLVELDMLNITAICGDYQKTLQTDRERAEELAYLTKGYSLAFQAVGYHYWNALCRSETGEVELEDIITKLDITLSELVYDKIRDEFSNTDIRILKAMAELSETEGRELLKVEEIRNALEMSSDSFTKYRERLLDSGVVDGKQYGYLRFKLPRFKEYIQMLHE